MARGGRDKNRDDPERKCIATGEISPKVGLIRFVVGPDAQIVPDINGKLPGRGIYVSAERSALAVAMKKKLFSRAAKQQVSVPDDLPELVEALIKDRVIGLLSLARKAGDAVTGFEKVKEWIVSGQGAVLIQASDGSERGKSKLRPPDGEETFIGSLTGSELGLAFGRENVIHGALAAGGLTTRVVEEAAKLKSMREDIGGPTAGKGTKTT